MLKKYLWPLRRAITIGLALKMAGAVSELLLPYILAHIIDKAVPRGNEAAIYFWGAMMLLAALGALVGNIWANRRSARVASDAARKIRRDLFTKTLYLSARQVNRFTEASLESRLTSDTYHLHNMISRLQRIGVRAPILLLGGLIMTFLLDWQLALILISLLPLISVFTLWIARRGRPKYTRQQQAADGLVRKVRETVSGIRVIKSLVTEEREKEAFGKINREVVRLEKDAAFNMALTSPVMTFMLNFGLTLVLLIGGWLINIGRTDYGAIVAFLTYFTIITNAMLAITRIFTIYNRGMASAERIEEVLNAPEDQEWTAEDLSEDDVSADTVPHIEFRNVTFTYPNNQEPSLTDISFTLNRGETLGILGETGSGKSTLAALLLRFYDVREGEILIEGQDIRQIPRERLYRIFGVSLQSDFLYGDTVRANVDFGRGLPDEALETAAKQAQAWDFLQEKEGALDYRLSSRGSNLSGGQKQRLLIARAIAGEPEILLLDDSSSALDYQTDANLRQVLNRDFSSTTNVIIAQRISSLKHADLILLLKDGKTAARGRHEELLASSAEYQEIAAVQMGLKAESGDELAQALEMAGRMPGMRMVSDDGGEHDG